MHETNCKNLISNSNDYCFLPANADDTSNAKPVSSTKLEKTVVDTQTPRTLGDLFITCYYNNECLEVEFPADADCMDITISDGAERYIKVYFL